MRDAQGVSSPGLLVVVSSAMQSIIIVKFVTSPHRPKLLLNVIPNYLILSTNMHNQVKEFVALFNVIEPY